MTRPILPTRVATNGLANGRTSGPRRSRWALAQSNAVARRPIVEPLERRQLLTVAVGTPLANTYGQFGQFTTVDLAGTFDDTAVSGQVVRFITSLGNVDVELFDQSAPRTAANFLNYVDADRYNNTVIDRSEPGFLIKGGGYDSAGAHVETERAIKNEYGPDRPNVRGTIGMFRLPATDVNGNPVAGGGPDTATSEWFVNLADNTESLGPNNDGGLTVFGQVINNTMATVDAIAALQRIDASVIAAPFDNLPVRNIPAGAPGPNDFVFVDDASAIPDTKFLSFTAESSDPLVIAPTIADGVLTLSYGSQTGSATITVTAADGAGNTASQTFVAGNGELTVEIGSAGVGAAIPFTEADGGRGSVSLKGGGSAFVKFTGTDLGLSTGRRPAVTGSVAAISSIEVIDTTTNTTLAVATKGGDRFVDLGTLTTDGPLKALSAKTTRVANANVTVGGTVRTVALGTLSGSDVTIGGSAGDGVSLALSLGSATNVNVTSGVPIKSVKATEFLSTNFNPSTLTAPAVTSVAVKGALVESIVATDAAIKSIKAGGAQKGNITAGSLGSLSAAALEGGEWTFTSGGTSLGKLSVKGAIQGTTVRTAGDIGSIAANEVTSGRFYAGVDINVDESIPPFLPTDLAQFTATARIAAVKIKARTNQLSMAASRVGKLTLGEVASDDPIPFGVAATEIAALAGRTPPSELGPGSKFGFKNLDDQATFNAEAAAKGISLGSFNVVLF